MTNSQTDIMRPSNGQGQFPSFAPAVDILENGDEYLFVLDIPGVAEGDLNIEVADRHLAVTACQQKGHLARLNFERRFELPRDGDVDAISAQLANGVLTVSVKKEASARPRKIKVNGQ